jgi:hypothetical protein
MRKLSWWLGAVVLVTAGCGVGDGQEGSDVGTLITASSQCPDRSAAYVEHYTCLGESIVAVIEDRGAAAGVGEMLRLVEADPMATTACHQAAHYAGRQYQSVKDIIELLEVEDGTCDFGLTHGAVEGLHRLQDDAEFYDAADQICASVPAGVVQYNCAHGLGHAIAIRDKGEIAKLMHSCGQLKEAYQTGCVTALAMAYTSEKASFADDVAVEIPPIADLDLAGLCESVSGEAANTCWQQIGGMYRGDLQNFSDWGNVTCARAVEAGYGNRCANGYGQALYFQQTNAGNLEADSIRGNFEAATKNCLTGEILIDCIVGVSGAAASYWSAERSNFDGYPDLCGGFEEPIRSACLGPENQWRENEASLQLR